MPEAERFACMHVLTCPPKKHNAPSGREAWASDAEATGLASSSSRGHVQADQDMCATTCETLHVEFTS